jgi:hypothetical protein
MAKNTRAIAGQNEPRWKRSKGRSEHVHFRAGPLCEGPDFLEAATKPVRLRRTQNVQITRPESHGAQQRKRRLQLTSLCVAR